jgi:hypothetical protein
VLALSIELSESKVLLCICFMPGYFPIAVSSKGFEEASNRGMHASGLRQNMPQRGRLRMTAASGWLLFDHSRGLFCCHSGRYRKMISQIVFFEEGAKPGFIMDTIKTNECKLDDPVFDSLYNSNS